MMDNYNGEEMQDVGNCGLFTGVGREAINTHYFKTNGSG